MSYPPFYPPPSFSWLAPPLSVTRKKKICCGIWLHEIPHLSRLKTKIVGDNVTFRHISPTVQASPHYSPTSASRISSPSRTINCSRSSFSSQRENFLSTFIPLARRSSRSSARVQDWFRLIR